MHHTDVLLAFFLVFIAAQVGAEIAARLKLPAVVGEIAAGVLVGPSLLGWISVAPKLGAEINHSAEPLLALAELGAVLLLFSVGLETRLADLKKVGKIAFGVGVLGLVVPFILGGLWAHFSGYPGAKALFIAAAFVATSAGITARVLSELGVLGRIEARIILGAAVIDDILAMLLLGVVTSLQSGKGVSVIGLALVTIQAVGFVALVALVGTKLLRRSGDALDAPINPLSPLTLSIAACLGLAAAGAALGLAPIIGAFLAGMAFAETPQRHQLEKQIQVIMAFLTPFFFVVTGTQVDLAALASVGAIVSLVVITALAIVGKLVGGALAARSLGRKSALVVGWGMVPRGEVGIIVASLGRGAGVFDNRIYALIIAMSLLTSVVTPPFLKKQLAGLPPENPAPDEDNSLYKVQETGHG
ncbi:transporter, CPA2 family [Abditibacterium utsteinense]|uniref:Transporter, CPA2 family n=1 Tax=Abditibacterium utsteinense TaxID=1960156 RepID=A0A2S8SRH1_9BACT|nr:cation:proton antiporter [Abditibacterium utsteinense]PQV63387.1 transporter, CPA2 family [Abditibacterium utsteinense]